MNRKTETDIESVGCVALHSSDALSPNLNLNEGQVVSIHVCLAVKQTLSVSVSVMKIIKTYKR